MPPSRFPDFFIIGAPKCGTTALYEYLSSHPKVFMPRVKEPHYFSSDFPALRLAQDESAYLALFSPANPDQLLGEASVWYMFSKTAIREILRARPDAKFIVMLRNPAEVAPALHAQIVLGFSEDILDFEEAWRAQDERAAGRRIPIHCREPRQLRYGSICSFSAHIEELLKIIPREQLMIVFYEEFFTEPSKHYQSVLIFLDLPPDGKTQFERLNVNLAPQNLTMHRLISRPPIPFRHLWIFLRKLSHRFGLHLGVLAAHLTNVRPNKRQKLRPEFEQELYAFFAADALKLESLLGRRLDFWRAPSRPPADI